MAKRSSNKSKRRSSSTTRRTRSSKSTTPQSPPPEAAVEAIPPQDKASTSDADAVPTAVHPETPASNTVPADASTAPPAASEVMRSEEALASADLETLETAIARAQDLLARLDSVRQDIDRQLQGWSAEDSALPSPQEMTEAIDYLGKTVVQLEATVQTKADPQAIALNTESIVNLHEQVSQLERQFASTSESTLGTEGAIAPLQTQLHELTRRIESAPPITSDITALQTHLADLQTRIDTWPNPQVAIEELQKQLDSLATATPEIASWQQDCDRRLEALGQQLESARGRDEAIPNPSESIVSLQTDLSAVRETLARLSSEAYLSHADFEPWQQTLQALQEDIARIPDASLVRDNAAHIETLQALNPTIEALATRTSAQEQSLTQQAAAIAQLAPVVLELQTQLAALETTEHPAIASLTTQVEALASNAMSYADRQAASENAEAIAHLQTQLNILPDPTAEMRDLQSRLDATDSARAELQQAIATVQTQLEEKADLANVPDRTRELAHLTERVESLAASGEQASERTVQLRETLDAIAAWKAEFGDQLSPAEILAALDFLGQKITQYETDLANLDSRVRADMEESVASLRHDVNAASALVEDIAALQSQHDDTAKATHRLADTHVELRAIVEDLVTRTAPLETWVAQQDESERSRTELAEAIASCQAKVATLSDWKQQFGEQLSPAEILEALDFLGKSITRFEPDIAKKIDRAELQSLADEISGHSRDMSDLQTQQAELSEAIAISRTEVAALSDWKHQFGDQLSPAEMLEALDFLGKSITQFEPAIAQKTDRAELQSLTDEVSKQSREMSELQARHAEMSEAIATSRADMTALSDWKQQFGEQLSPAEMLEALDLLGKSITQYDTKLAQVATQSDLQPLRTHIEQSATKTELQVLREELTSRTSGVNNLQVRQTELADAIASYQNELSILQGWKQQFGDQLSPAEMLEALDFLGQTITRYEPQLERKAEAEAVKLNTETLMGLQEMLNAQREHLNQVEERPGQNEIAIATLTQKLATADRTREQQVKELHAQAVEIDRLNTQLVQLQNQLTPEQLRRSLEDTGWSPERITKVAKHMQSLAQAQTTLRRWAIAIGGAALGAMTLALSELFGFSIG